MFLTKSIYNSYTRMLLNAGNFILELIIKQNAVVLREKVIVLRIYKTWR